jgi:hypothetical protein
MLLHQGMSFGVPEQKGLRSSQTGVPGRKAKDFGFALKPYGVAVVMDSALSCEMSGECS